MVIETKIESNSKITINYDGGNSSSGFEISTEGIRSQNQLIQYEKRCRYFENRIQILFDIKKV